ncbi:Tex-like N-terminal domain-containing protein [Posidoniimonas polymericola]|nr:Tex family protein [Posidoniimonas polymericola]
MGPNAINLKPIANELGLDAAGVEQTVQLLDAGNTVPFITRYRRDATGGFDEQQIEAVRDRVHRARQLEERRETILRSLKAQRKLSDDLQEQISRASSVAQLEDLYLPFKPKRQSLAEKAKSQGLAPLADEIFRAADSCADLDKRAADFIDKEQEVPDAATALVGAGHILAERFAESSTLRKRARKVMQDSGQLVSKAVDGLAEKRKATFKDFLDYREKLSRAPTHRILAINRGEREKALKVSVECDAAAIEQAAIELLVPAEHAHRDFLVGCVRDAARRLLVPSLQREARRALTEKAEEHSLTVFARNLRRLLLQPPIRGKRVLALDPGYKNGCKLAALDEFGGLVAHDLIHLVGGEDKQADGRKRLAEMIREHSVELIAIGNGRACRPSEQLVAELLADELKEHDAHYVVVNEAGASVYSTSTIGREELPELDASHRSAVSIARRLQDPLSELVKIDPASLGVGLYQHDSRNKPMRDTLNQVVESCVSFVGVDLNNASPTLLSHVAGLNPLTARRVYEHRVEKGPFKSRQQLLEVKGVGESAFVQSAGFLKVEDGENPLDATWVHPESYDAAAKLLELVGVDAAELRTPAGGAKFQDALAERNRDELAESLGVGRLSLDQLVDSLSRPGRDLRDDRPPPVFRRDVVKIDDLEIGSELAGVVLNVVDFGAFVDIGLSESGLVHVSQLSSGYVRDPHTVVAVGDRVRVWVTSIDAQRRRVALTMIKPGTPQAEGGRKEKSGESGGGRRQRPKRKSGEAASRSGDGRSGDGKPSGRKPRGKSGRGDRRVERAPAGPRVFEQRAKKESKALTKDMEEGKEAMRSFGDLLQFHKKKSSDDK